MAYSNSERFRRHQDKVNPNRGPGPRIRADHMAVECWCRTEIVHVPSSVVLACLTDTCGRDWCHAPS